ncbi:hypothetical protein GY45DRAFT_1358293 [Cubamyces sp. BRFM 1775]|nr:hypothetical protein GY45DRAFT_1358293 [Cubamyces sp. BRFM 1775]
MPQASQTSSHPAGSKRVHKKRVLAAHCETCHEWDVRGQLWVVEASQEGSCHQFTHCSVPSLQWQFVKTAQGYAIQCFKRAQDANRGLYIAWPESEFNIELAWENSGATDKIALGLRGNQKGIPFDPALWCYSCVGSPAGDLPEPASGERQKSMSRTAQRGGHTFPNTTVHLLTHQAKTVLEADRTSSLVRNRPVQQGVLVENQQWRFIPLGAGYIIESCSKSPSGEPLYLAVDGHARSGASVVVSRYPASWRVEYVLSSLRLFWPTTDLAASVRVTDDRVVLAEYDKGPLSKWDDTVVEDAAVVPRPNMA